jgi:hypothetical protein
MSKDELRELQALLPGMTDECVDKARFDGITAISNLNVDQCFEMNPARNWRGLWRNDFEGSRFCAEPATQCEYETPGEKIWLSYSDSLRQQATEPREGDGGRYEIELEGRRTVERGHHGHFGASDHEVVVDRIISIRPVPAS